MGEMTNKDTRTKAAVSRWGWLSKIGAGAALVSGILLLLGMISLIVTVLQPGTPNAWLLPFQNNWLVKIFIQHAELSGIPADLHGLNLLDMVILLLVSLVCLSLSTYFRNAGKVWSLIAFGLSVAAMLLFWATQLAGRSTVMLAVLINSFVMLRDKTFSRVIIYSGILAGVFLFAGDLTVGIHSNIITILFGVGYALLIIWSMLIAQALFRPGQVS